MGEASKFQSPRVSLCFEQESGGRQISASWSPVLAIPRASCVLHGDGRGAEVVWGCREHWQDSPPQCGRCENTGLPARPAASVGLSLLALRRLDAESAF